MGTLVVQSKAKRPRVAVIGSGFGGLAVAIRLQAAGCETVLFEARDKPGGRAYVYERDGFVFDGGPTVITAPAAFEELFAAAGRKLADYTEFLPVRPFYRLIWDDGDRFDYVGDSAEMVRQIERRNPADVRGYLDFVEYSRKVYERGYEGLAATPFLRFSEMVKVAPALVRLRADRSVYDTVSAYVSDEHLRQALSFHSLLVGGNPFDTSAIYTLIHYLERHGGVYFPRGGTGALVQALLKVYGELGGELRLSSPVLGITVDSAGSSVKHLVSTKLTRREPFDLVVSNADVHHTYSRLYEGNVDALSTQRTLERKKWSMSLFVLYFGTDRTYDIAHHTVIFGARYKGLLDEIFRGSSLPQDFSLYLHSPTVTDPSLAPPGCGTFYVLSPVPHLGNAPLAWDHIADEYAERILIALERHLPDLRKHIKVKQFITPRDFERDLGAYNGSAFSVAPVLQQSAWFRPHNRDPKIPGLYLVGAGTHPGAGLPGVVASAKATASVIAQDFGLTG
ncbi:MAG: phytoene desaturase [Polyangiaceae bacterium]